jgi:cob(I)alamin adenosyltransferase
MAKSKIYTGGGDKGKTSLVGGFRVSKTHPRIEAYGTVDELNSFIGLLLAEIADDESREILLFVQSKLFTAGSYLAVDPSSATSCKIESEMSADSIKKIEEAIDRIDGCLPKLKSFVLPGGCRSASIAHVCRTVCRRAERNIYRLTETGAAVEESVLVFMNRLSDLLFVIARRECLLKNGKENFWSSICK